MMTVASEYGAALFTLSEEENVKGDVADSLKVIKDLILGEPSYIDLLAAPDISVDERCSIVDAAFDGRVHEYALSFVKLILERGHIRELLDCIDEFMRLYDEFDGVVLAEVVSAVPLSEDEKLKLAKKLENRFSMPVELACSVDESILGGVIVRADGKVMDGSLKTRLADVGSVIGGK